MSPDVNTECIITMIWSCDRCEHRMYNLYDHVIDVNTECIITTIMMWTQNVYSPRSWCEHRMYIHHDRVIESDYRWTQISMYNHHDHVIEEDNLDIIGTCCIEVLWIHYKQNMIITVCLNAFLPFIIQTNSSLNKTAWCKPPTAKQIWKHCSSIHLSSWLGNCYSKLGHTAVVAISVNLALWIPHNTRKLTKEIFKPLAPNILYAILKTNVEPHHSIQNEMVFLSLAPTAR